MNINVMPVMEAVVTLFVVMIVGIIGRITGILNSKTTKSLSEVLVKITQPMLIIASLQIDFTKEKLSTGLWLILISGITHIAITVFASFLYRKHPQRQRKVYIMGTVFGNCAFMGFPILIAMFPADGLFYGAFYTFFFNFYLWTYGTFILAKGSSKQYNPLKSLLNVGTISCIISFLMFVFQIRLPAPVLNAVTDIGSMTFPLAMLIVGALIGGLGIKNMFSGQDGYFYSIVKLLLLPAITLLICVIFRLDKGLTLLLVAMNSVPSAANNAIFAELYNADAPLGAKLVGLSTLFSVATIPLMLLLTTWILSLT